MENEENKKINIKELENSQVEISGEVEWEKLKNYKSIVVKDLAKNLEISGFRKGHVPEDVAIKHVGEDEVLNRSAEKVLQEIYPKILLENKIEAIGRPFISITKLAENNPLGFKITTSIMPSFELPEYKSIAKKVNSSDKKDENEITEKELETAIKTIREQWAKFEKLEEEKKKSASGKDSNEKKEKIVNPQDIKIEEANLPEFNDEFVKKLSPEYKSVDDFKNRLKENMKKEKEMRNKEKNRIEIIESVLEKTKITVPELLIESELQRMMFQFEEDLKKAKMDKKFYLANVKKTEEELKEEWKKGAEKKTKIQLLLDKIAKEEKLKPDEKRVNSEIEHVKSHHKDVDENRIRTHIEGLLLNEAVMEFLENQK